MNLMEFKCYKCKSGILPGHNYAAIVKIAWQVFKSAAAQTKRRPYIRSAYFGGEKIFLDNFWPHLNQKNPRDRWRRLQFLKAAIELIHCSCQKPIIEQADPTGREIFYRFIGICSGRLFVVQIKEDCTRRQKFFMSAFAY